MTLRRPPHRARGGHAYGSRVRLSSLASCGVLPAWVGSLIGDHAAPRMISVALSKSFAALKAPGEGWEWR